MPSEFLSLIERLRGGDEQATQELIDEYGEAVRRAIRMHMLDRRLGRVIGESDLFQSVISRFLFDLWAGRYDFDRPEHLAALLKKMAVARVSDAARRHTAQRRDIRRNDGAPIDEHDLSPRHQATPSQVIANRELLEKALGLMNQEEQRILMQRQDRIGWAEIAADNNKSPEAIRKQFERAINRVAAELSLEEA